MNDIQVLLKKTQKAAKKYKPKQEANWVSYYDKEGYTHTFEDLNDYTYYETCIAGAMKDAEKMELPDDFAEMTYQTETSVEKSDFLTCETCGEIINCSSIITMQEIEHWLNIEKFDITDIQDCYELHVVLNKGKHEFAKECELIAKHILSLIA
jgi:Fe2+ or Zn2+ uptake regulation protein